VLKEGSQGGITAPLRLVGGQVEEEWLVKPGEQWILSVRRSEVSGNLDSLRSLVSL
jgi:hypothetical protein